MAFMPLNFDPSVSKDNSVYASRGGVVDSNMVRPFQGSVQTIGGWTAALTGSLLQGTCRAVHTFADLSGNKCAAFGTTRKLYVMKNQSLFDITPIRASGAFLANAFHTNSGSNQVNVTLASHGAFQYDTVWLTTTAGSAFTLGGLTLSGYTENTASVITTTAGQTLLQVAFTAHGLSTGDIINISGASAVGGITPAGIYNVIVQDANTLLIYSDTAATSSATGGGTPAISGYKSFQISLITGANTFNITAKANASSTATGGTNALHYQFEFNTLRELGVPGLGYGIGPYGLGTYGTARTATGQLPGLWTLDNLGQYLEACPRGDTIYEWQQNPSRRAAPVTNAPSACGTIFVDTLELLNALGVEASSQYQPMTQANSDLGDNTVWAATASNQASSIPLTKGSTFVRGKSARGENLLWTDTSLYSQRYLGLPTATYQYTLLGTDCGLIGANAADVQAGYAFWVSSEKKFFQYSGGQPLEVPCENRKWFFDQVDPDQNEQIFVSFNSDFDEVWIFYPPTQAYMIYNYVDKKWMLGNLDRTAWKDGDIFPNSIAVDSLGQVYFQDYGLSANGQPIHAWVTLGPQEISPGTFCMNFNKLINSFVIQGPGLNVTFYGQREPFAPVDTTKGPFLMTATTQTIDTLIQCRQLGIKFETNGVGNYWRVDPGEMRIDVDQGSRW